MTQELRRLAEAANTTAEQRANMQTAQHNAAWLARDAFKNACTPAAILELLDRLEKAEKDAVRLKFVQDNIYLLPYDDHGAGPEFDLSNETIDKAMEASK